MRILDAIRRRPWALAALGVATVALFALGGFYGYKTYDFIEHDNDFCMSCHLMAEPFELFGESEHRGLGCKACHQPSMVERSSMALTQIIENPEELQAHAEVPDERCVTCHVEGDPGKWLSIKASAGHRVHLESTDSTLTDVSCVGCHSSSLHEFTAVDETCAQSGCHTDNRINLGTMSDLTIHCAACHSFSAPIDESVGTEAARVALSPAGGDCLSCHAMRERVQMPDDDPHDELCASCHNPHEQDTPAQAVQTCAVGGCHEDALELTDYHVGLGDDGLANCVACHQAHDFHVDGSQCAACHQDVFDVPGTLFDDVGRVGGLRSSGGAGVLFASMAHAEPGVRAIGLRADSVVFEHAEHREVACLSCHSTEGTHGRATVTTLTDCRTCHHTEPVKTDCAACHRDPPFVPGAGSRVHEMAFEVVDALERALPFDHEAHTTEDCSTCHTDQGGVTLSAASVSCSSCHEDHHEPAQVCRACHVEAPVENHPVEEVHVGCSGAGCHNESAFDLVPRTREFCLACHQELVDHKVDDDRDCAVCHTLPDPRPVGGGGP